MTTHPLGAECDHGTLARSCPRCEDAETIAKLREGCSILHGQRLSAEAARDRAVALVRRAEWAGRANLTGFPCCLACGRLWGDGHAPGWEIAEVLRD